MITSPIGEYHCVCKRAHAHTISHIPHKLSQLSLLHDSHHIRANTTTQKQLSLINNKMREIISPAASLYKEEILLHDDGTTTSCKLNFPSLSQKTWKFFLKASPFLQVINKHQVVNIKVETSKNQSQQGKGGDTSPQWTQIIQKWNGLGNGAKL